ncbi:MAG: hypothetical protein IJU76_14000 [Desulfovibrionaceae bacterium]|nr:hypothetical protein [Desulfovibrionaceae bacterium]
MSRIRKAVLAAQCGHAQRGLGEDGQTITVRYCFPPTSPVFDGHFPGKPVLPAVVQILMAQLAIGDTQCQIADAKFLEPVGPDEALVLTCLFTKMRWVCTIEKNGQRAAQIRFASCDMS